METDVDLMELAARLKYWGECNAIKLEAISSIQPTEDVKP
jgi:hypothetical protein